MLRELGTYRVSVLLEDEQGEMEELPFEVTLIASCPENTFLRVRRRDASDTCQACPSVGVQCFNVPLPHTLESLKLKPGFWRLSNSTIDIHRVRGTPPSSACPPA